MIKRITLLFILALCCLPLSSEAGFWKKVSKCYNDPCNCGDNNPKIHEFWHDNEVRDPKKDRNCPPYNRSEGRKDNTCLVKPGFNYPNGVTSNVCGEAMGRNTKKLRVRAQMCNKLFCWSESKVVSGHGECVIFPGPSLFPLTRICGRVALPKVPESGVSQDPGYTNGVHLDSQGGEEDDDPIYDSEGNVISDIELPKYCLFNDPSLITFSGADLMDLNPVWQPLHKTTETHPIIVIIQFIYQLQYGLYSGFADVLAMIFDLMSDESSGKSSDDLSIMADIFTFIADVFAIIGDTIISLLSEIGQMNRVVLDKQYGCVNLPMGPFPPPYCEKISTGYPMLSLYQICPDNVDSTKSKPCVTSSVTNNYIQNSVRASYDDFVPLCREGEDPMITDACVTIENLGVFASASALHATTENKDIIKPCSAAGSSEPCVKSMITFLTNDLRVVYGNKMGSTISKQDAYNSDSTDCSATDTNNCQQIWGINKGQFKDVSLTFPADQDPTDMLPLTNTANLFYNNNNSTSIYFSIVKDSEDHFDYSFTQDPGQICAFVDGRNWYDCVSRASPPNLIVSNATGSTYFTPIIRASYTDGNNTTSAIIKPASVYDAEDTINTEINLAGTMIKAFVTDEQYHTKPFLGPNSPNTSSIYGIYQDDIKPIDSVGDENEDAVYLKGLEYLNGEYHLGGRYACLSKIGVSDCPDNPEMCVLTNLLNSDVVKCGDFLKKSQEEGINQCTGSETGCTYSDSISKIGSGTIDIKTCDGSVKCYDWDVELCATSYDAADRVDPLPDFGSVLPKSKYYDTTAPNYDADLHIVRSKTSVEQGLCVTITRPTCTSVNDYSQENGYASWPETKVEEEATGSCRSGYSSPTPLTRYCIPLDETQAVAFEPLYRVQPDGSFQYPSDLCQPLVCPAETNSAENGHASWTSAAFGSDSVGTCESGYNSPGPITRPCILLADGSSVELGEMSGECTKIEYCTAITSTNGVSDGHATWTTATVGGNSVGTCITNYYSDATLTRTCELSNGTPTFGAVSAVCSPVMCQGVTSSTTTSWPNSFPGVNIAGSCPPGYEGSVSRDCNLSSDGKTATYGSVSGTCTPKVCPAENRDPNAAGSANASWEAAIFGDYSRGNCKNGQNYNGSLLRKCVLAPGGSSVMLEPLLGSCK